MYHFYYLHTNGSLIHKNDTDGIETDFRESDFIRHFWPMDVTDRETAWNILVEALSLGADPIRIKELAEKWYCDNEDALVYAKRIGCKIFEDGSQWCATKLDFINIQESKHGFGPTALEAMAKLCKELGFRSSKMWGHTFRSLLK